MTEEELRQHIEEVEKNPLATVFNNFHSLFPGGYRRSYTAELACIYLIGDHRLSLEKINKVFEDLKLWVLIDTKIQELGYKLSDVWEWEHYQNLESDHKELMIKIFVYLTNLGYGHHQLAG